MARPPKVSKGKPRGKPRLPASTRELAEGSEAQPEPRNMLLREPGLQRGWCKKKQELGDGMEGRARAPLRWPGSHSFLGLPAYS